MSNREQRRASQSWFNKGKKHAVENRISDLDYILKNILSYYPNNLTCLDVGCAEGDMLDYFSKRFSRVVGLEKYDSLFNVAAAKFADAASIEVVRGDILTDKIDEYDFTFCLGVLHYFDLESEKLTVLRNVLSNTRCFSFFRTAFYENKSFFRKQQRKSIEEGYKDQND